jgi:hypothetical protein
MERRKEGIERRQQRGRGFAAARFVFRAQVGGAEAIAA